MKNILLIILALWACVMIYVASFCYEEVEFGLNLKSGFYFKGSGVKQTIELE